MVSCSTISVAEPGTREVSDPAPRQGWSPALGRPPAPGDEYVNRTDGSVLVWIPGGEFIMGTADGLDDQKPPHKVRVEGFWLGKHEVSNRQYARFLKGARHRPPGYWDDPDCNQPDQPVVAVTCYEAEAYCSWAGVRLPTEEEWEYAAAAGQQLKHPTATGEISHDLANYAGTGGKDRWDVPSPVGSFEKNPFGLYDMAGNAWELTSSPYGPYPGAPAEAAGSSYGLRVLRGGCWHFAADRCTTYYRHRFASHLRYDYTGFRVALSGPAREKASQ
jgi:formylglycine-generating enzyme required for sulfatase activity